MRVLRFSIYPIIFFCAGVFFGCRSLPENVYQKNNNAQFSESKRHLPLEKIDPITVRRVIESANLQLETTKTYDPAYVVLDYPNGDVSPEKGVCTDVVVRAFRNAGVDLQKEVHEDMTANFSVYPKKWGLARADANIDHRRVPNLQTFFTRRGKSLAITQNSEDYIPGDVVSWDLDNRGMTHIGLISNVWNEKTARYSIIHNIGGGAVLEDAVFNWKITGHYRYF